jgi:NAD(P)-dependent dehydrogenase (short-subunit alcohol dehydrogenase family)
VPIVINLEGKVAVVTGSGRGIGKSYAKALAAHGAAVVVNDIDNDVCEATVEEISASGGRAVGEAVGVGPTEAAERLVARAVEAFGRLDIMVTNAGVLRDKMLWKLEDEDFDLVISTHLRGTFTCVRAAAIQLRKQNDAAGDDGPKGGRIVAVSSVAGQYGNFGQTAYAAAKAGIAAMVRTWALELERASVTVNAIVPNALTRMVATIPGMGEAVEAAERGEPVPEAFRMGMGMGTPDDVAPLLVFLASDDAAGVTGQAIGLGGDKLSLFAHPYERSMAYMPGGWSAERIAELFKQSVGQDLEAYGIPFLGRKKPG